MKRQKFVGTGFFDEAASTIAPGQTSITGDPGKSVEGERDSAGSVAARKRSNVRGAKRPCCFKWL
jgi:hypothetical protein